MDLLPRALARKADNPVSENLRATNRADFVSVTGLPLGELIAKDENRDSPPCVKLKRKFSFEEP